MKKGLDYAGKTQNIHALGPYSIYRQFILTMQSTKGDWTSFNQDGFEEETYFKENEQSVMASCYFYIYKTQLLFMFKAYDMAWETALKAKDIHTYITGFIPVSNYYFYMALCLCKRLSPSEVPVSNQDKKNAARERNTLLSELNTHVDQLKVWGDGARENWMHKYYLVEAEKHRALMDVPGAIRFFHSDH